MVLCEPYLNKLAYGDLNGINIKGIEPSQEMRRLIGAIFDKYVLLNINLGNLSFQL